VEALLNNRVTELVMSSEFTKRKKFKLKKIERLIYVRNIDTNRIHYMLWQPPDTRSNDLTNE